MPRPSFSYLFTIQPLLSIKFPYSCGNIKCPYLFLGSLFWSTGSHFSPAPSSHYLNYTDCKLSIASLVAQVVKKSGCNVGRPGFNPWVGKIPWRRERLPTPIFWTGESHGLYSPWSCRTSLNTCQGKGH